MRSIRVSRDIVPVSDFKADAAAWLEHLARTDHPVVITQNGKPAGVLLSPSAFDGLTERARFLAAIDEGLADERAGRTRPHEGVFKRLKQRGRRRSR